MNGKNLTPGRSMGFGRLDVVTQSRCVNEPLYMFSWLGRFLR